VNFKEMADKLCAFLEVCDEPAGVSGCFWSLKGPRRSSRMAAKCDDAALRQCIEDALKAAYRSGRDDAMNGDAP